MVESLTMSPTTMRLFASLVFAVILAAPSWARQEPLAVKRAVEDFLRIQTNGLPGQVSFTVGPLDPNNNLAPCSAFEVGQAPGTRAWGRITVTVRCVQDGSWNVFVPVTIRVVADYIVASHPLSQGQVVRETDLARQNGNLADLPAGTLTDLDQAIGRTATMPIPGGKPLRADMLRQVSVIQQGQSVKVVSSGPGFQVANEGRALNNAVDGQVAQVRLANGQVVSGIARAGGYVEIGF